MLEEPTSDFDRLLEEQIPRLRRYARALTRNIQRADDVSHPNYQPDRDVISV